MLYIKFLVDWIFKIIYCLHIGHTFYLASHYFMHSEWNECLHGNVFIYSPSFAL